MPAGLFGRENKKATEFAVAFADLPPSLGGVGGLGQSHVRPSNEAR
jgi:hypothetical protein